MFLFHHTRSKRTNWLTGLCLDKIWQAKGIWVYIVLSDVRPGSALSIPGDWANIQIAAVVVNAICISKGLNGFQVLNSHLLGQLHSQRNISKKSTANSWLSDVKSIIQYWKGQDWTWKAEHLSITTAVGVHYPKHPVCQSSPAEAWHLTWEDYQWHIEHLHSEPEWSFWKTACREWKYRSSLIIRPPSGARSLCKQEGSWQGTSTIS